MTAHPYTDFQLFVLGTICDKISKTKPVTVDLLMEWCRCSEYEITTALEFWRDIQRIEPARDPADRLVQPTEKGFQWAVRERLF